MIIRNPEAGGTVVYTFQCQRCMTSFPRVYDFTRGSEPPLPTPPPNWQNLNGDWICEKHTVTVTREPSNVHPG